MRIAAVALVLALVGCLDDAKPLPTCAELGCPIAPSGSPDQWEPCDDGGICWCGVPALTCTFDAR